MRRHHPIGHAPMHESFVREMVDQIERSIELTGAPGPADRAAGR